METKIKELEVKICKADSILADYKKEPVYSKKKALMHEIDEILEQVGVESNELLEIETKELSEESSKRWRQICSIQNEVARIRRTVIEYINKTAA